MNTTMRQKTWRIMALLIVVAMMVSPLSVEKTTAQDNDKLNIVATTTQARDLVQIIAGDRVELTALMGAGVDPHLYQPTEADVSAMREADLIVYSGLHLEGQFDAVFEALSEQGTRIYAMSAPVKQAGFVIGAFDPELAQLGTDDPHFWFDPRNWQITVSDFAELLADIDPDNADFYLANAEAYVAQLDLLYDWAFEGMSQVSGRSRYLVTSHDAFQYFGSAFGWRQRGLQGISTEDEAGVADVQAVAEFVVENEIPVMFVESSVPPDAIEAVQEAVQASGFEVELGVRELYSDAMGEPDTFGGTYVGMIATNVITVLQSYGVDIPDWPEELELEPPRELLDMTDIEE